MDVYTYGDMQAANLLLQMTDDHDQSLMEQEVAYITEYAEGIPFGMITCKVDSWTDDLSPWPAPPVFGNDAFGNGASGTLSRLLEEVLPGYADVSERAGITGMAQKRADRRLILGGYSLAGLFALWAAYQTDCFSGVAAASPSVWFPGFVPYAMNNEIRTEAVYLSLGDREEKTKSPAMSTVGDAIRSLGSYYAGQKDLKSVLEWNRGNHFKEPDRRTARAFAWVMKALS